MPLRLADRLNAARRAQIVGRERETALFLEALHAEELPFHLLHVYGPGGIGKSTLLRLFAGLAVQEGVRVASLDGRNLDADPKSFEAALADALGLPPEAVPASALDGLPGRVVLLLDTYELLAPLDTWLREVFMPALPAHVLVVTAGRHPLGSAWLADPGWQALAQSVQLGPLSDDEGRAYLTHREVAPEQQDAVIAFTHGHPLALSLVADLFDLNPELAFQPDAAPDVVAVLIEQFIQHVPGPEHRAALEACALVRGVNEALLGEMMGVEDARPLFEWMRHVSFINAGPYGLYPHDLAREALATDLRWRNPDRFALLHDRARAYYARRLSETVGRDQQRVLSDYMYLHRDNPVIKPFIDWQETGSAVPEPPTEADLPLLIAMVERHEGEDAAGLAAFWLERYADRALVFRGTEGQPAAFLLPLPLDELKEEDRHVDPAVQHALAYLDEHAPLRSGERATHFRFWMAADTYQGVSAFQSQIFLKIAQHYLTTPKLAFTFFPCADTEFWAPFCGYAELLHTPEAGYDVGEHSFGVFTHDWRVLPWMQWLDLLAARETATSDAPSAPVVSEQPVAVFDEAAFADAVRDAFRHYARPATLADHPLLSARIVTEAVGADADAADRIEALRHLLAEAAKTLEATPRDERIYRGLYRMYLHPSGSQEQVAEMLEVPLSTFRRHLKKATGRVAEILWQRELNA